VSAAFIHDSSPGLKKAVDLMLHAICYSITDNISHNIYIYTFYTSIIIYLVDLLVSRIPYRESISSQGASNSSYKAKNGDGLTAATKICPLVSQRILIREYSTLAQLLVEVLGQV